MNSRILVLSILLALPLGSAVAADASVVETKAVEAPAEGISKRLVRPTRFDKLELLLEAGRSEIAQLNEQLRAADAPETRNAIQLKIVAAKRTNRERFLEERMLLAEEEGDMIQAAQARRQLENLRNLHDNAQQAIERPVPSQGDGR